MNWTVVMHIYAACIDVSRALTVSNLFQEMKKITLLATRDSPVNDKCNACRRSTPAVFFFLVGGRRLYETIDSYHPLYFWRLWGTNDIPCGFIFFPQNSMVTGIVCTKVMDTMQGLKRGGECTSCPLRYLRDPAGTSRKGLYLWRTSDLMASELNRFYYTGLIAMSKVSSPGR